MQPLRPAVFATILLYCLTRFHALLSFPVFLDEAVHIRWAQSMWTSSLIPWQALSDGRFGNIVWIAAFWPFEGGLWLGRAATALLGVAGVAALIKTGERVLGPQTGWLAGLIYTAAPLAFFFDRLALADSVSASLVSLSLFFCLRAVGGQRPLFVLPAGAVFTALLFVKLNNLPFSLIPALTLLSAPRAFRRVLAIYLLTLGAAGLLLAAFVWRGGSDLGLDLVSARTGIGGSQIGANLILIIQSLWAWLTPGLAVIVAFGVMSARSRSNWIAVALAIAPLAGLAAISRGVENRFLVSALPGLALLGGHTLESSWRWIGARLTGPGRKGFAIGLGALTFALPSAFMIATYTQPGALRLPPADERQYLSGWPSGFGLREAAAQLNGVVYVEEAAFVPMLAMYLPPEHDMNGVWRYEVKSAGGEVAIIARSADEIATIESPALIVVYRERNDPLAKWQSQAVRLDSFDKPGGNAQIEIWQLP